MAKQKQRQNTINYFFNYIPSTIKLKVNSAFSPTRFPYLSERDISDWPFEILYLEGRGSIKCKYMQQSGPKFG